MTDEEDNEAEACAVCGEPSTEVYDGEPVCTEHAEQREDEALATQEENA